MRIAIMGAGAVGGWFGARLAGAGHDVTFIARGAHLKALQSKGLTLVDDQGSRCLSPVTATDDPATVDPVDLIVFSVKLYDTAEAALAMEPMIGPETVVLSLQNGVESAAMIRRTLKNCTVLSGAVYLVASLEAPGRIRKRGTIESLQFGADTGAGRRRVKAIEAALSGAGTDTRPEDDPALMLWRKFIMLAATSALTAVTRQPMGVVRADPVMRATMIRAIDEAIAVARAEGVALDGDIAARTLTAIDQVMGADAKASQLVDLENGKPLELEWLSGAIHRLGAAHGIDTPVHSTTYAALRPFAHGRR